MFREKIAAWLESKGHVAPSTLGTYQAVMDRFEGFLGASGAGTMDEAAGMLPAFIATLEEDGMSGTTIGAYVSRVKEFFRFHGVEANGGYRTTAKEKRRRQKKELARWFNEAEIKACLAYAFPANHLRNHLILRLLIETGMRVGELVSIRRSDANPQARTLLIGSSKTMIRHVVISEKSAALLQKYLGRNLELHLPEAKSTPTPLFPLTESGVAKVINRMLDDLSINAEGRGPHTFRHWAATAFCFNHNISLEHIAFLLGDTPETIRETYLHPTPQMLRTVFDPALTGI